MFRSLRNAAVSLERSLSTAFSTTPASHTAFANTTLTIEGRTVRLGRVIAEGGYSLIHIATPVGSTAVATRYAVKRVPCRDGEARRQAEREVEMLSRLGPHPNIVPFHGVSFERGHAFLLFSLIDGGTLPDRLSREHPLGRRTRSVVVQILGDILSALHHLHSQTPKIFFRDLKLENVLYDRLAKRYVLCDFGSATSAIAEMNASTSGTSVGVVEEEISEHCTAMYRAPELVDLYAGHAISEKADVWALGCVLHALMYDTLPFDGGSSLEISNGLVEEALPEIPRYPASLTGLLRDCLTVSPADRPDVVSLMDTVRRIGRGEAAAEQTRPLDEGSEDEENWADFSRGFGNSSNSNAGERGSSGEAGDLIDFTSDGGSTSRTEDLISFS